MLADRLTQRGRLPLHSRQWQFLGSTPGVRPSRAVFLLVGITILVVTTSQFYSLPVTRPHVFEGYYDYLQHRFDHLKETKKIAAPKPPRKHSYEKPPTHYYRPDGHVDVNLKSTHPIFELVARAETQWKAKHAMASTSLEEAVEEYRARYQRPPPAGFDKWWEYVQEHNVLLPDEYDRIYYDIEPFWAVDPKKLAEFQTELAAKDGSFTITSSRGKVTVNVPLPSPKYAGTKEHEFRTRANGQLDLLKSVERWLPDFKATFSNDRLPSQVVRAHIREAAVRAARDGRVVWGTNNGSRRKLGWGASCPPATPLAKQRSATLPDLTAIWANSSKSLIYDHPAAMDPCNNPSLVHLSGLLQAEIPLRPATSLVPSFTTCTTTLHNDILSVPSDDFLVGSFTDVAWNRKKHAKLHWRGSTAGAYYDSDHPQWNLTQRVRLIEAANAQDGDNFVLPGATSSSETLGSTETVEAGLLNADWMDVKFTGMPKDCEGKREGVSHCGEMQRRFEFTPERASEEEGQWKYLIDIDEFGCSSRFKPLLHTRSLIFKSTIHPEWYMDRIQPWLHYIPLKYDYSDLYDILAFFTGEVHGAERPGAVHGSESGQDAMAAAIASAGKKWVEGYWRREDMVAYVFRLFLEYARVMSPNRDSLHYV